MNPFTLWTAWAQASLEIADLLMPNMAVTRKMMIRAANESGMLSGNICKPG